MCPEDTGRAARRSEHPNGYALRRTGGGAVGQVQPGPRRRIAWEPAPDGSEHGYERVGAHTNMHAIGVDIGGTKIAAGVVDEDGTILAQTRRDTSPDDVAGIDKAIAERLPGAQPGPTRSGAIGVAAAGFVSADRSSVLFAPNIAWRDYPLRAEGRRRSWRRRRA